MVPEIHLPKYETVWSMRASKKKVEETIKTISFYVIIVLENVHIRTYEDPFCDRI